jgi:hypothetical protein
MSVKNSVHLVENLSTLMQIAQIHLLMQSYLVLIQVQQSEIWFDSFKVVFSVWATIEQWGSK